MNKINYFFILLIIFSLLSCDILNNEPPPFIITEPVCVLSDISFDFIYAGISFSFMNKSLKDINSITASFLLFDAKTKTNPFIGSNIFEIKKLIFIYPNENKEIILSLDKFIHNAPTEPYLIDFFYISEIEYTDGSVWEDKNGKYRK